MKLSEHAKNEGAPEGNPPAAVADAPSRNEPAGRPSGGARRRIPAVHPLFFAVYPVLFLFAHNQGEVGLDDLVFPLAVSALSSLAAWGILSWLVRGAQKAAVVVSFFVTLFFLYGQLYAAAADWTLFGFYFGSPRFTFVTWSVLATVGIYICLKINRGLGPLTLALDAASVLLVLSPAALIAFHELRPEVLFTLANHASAPATSPSQPAGLGHHPDIYYIVLDGYGRHDGLKEVFGYDNGPFLQFLRDHGFYVAEASRPNYAQTALSLSSSLNLCYLDEVARRVGPRSSDIRPIFSLLQKNKVVRFLRERGYRFVAFETGFSCTDFENADEYIRFGGTPSPFNGLILKATPIPVLFYFQVLHHQHEAHRKALRWIMDQAGAAAKEPGPKFVFAHVLAPHPPFVFDETGEGVDPDTPFGLWDGLDMHLDREEYIAGYGAQVQFITTQITMTISRILSESSEPPIIIVQGDHGPGVKTRHGSKTGISVPDRMSILNAYHLPFGGNERLYADITPVNSFRVIFDYYFGAGFELLPDRSYYSGYNCPYLFSEVTEQAAGGSSRKSGD